jgi:hypothetical protein
MVLADLELALETISTSTRYTSQIKYVVYLSRLAFIGKRWWIEWFHADGTVTATGYWTFFLVSPLSSHNFSGI